MQTVMDLREPKVRLFKAVRAAYRSHDTHETEIRGALADLRVAIRTDDVERYPYESGFWGPLNALEHYLDQHDECDTEEKLSDWRRRWVTLLDRVGHMLELEIMRFAIENGDR